VEAMILVHYEKLVFGFQILVLRAPRVFSTLRRIQGHIGGVEAGRGEVRQAREGGTPIGRKKRFVSKTARAKMAKAQRERWAKVKGKSA